jgi:hypothetical protein
MQLSPHFSLEEMTHTEVRLDNTPSLDVIRALEATARRMEAIRTLLGDRPIRVNSGYRSPAVNAAVGGARTSAHMAGHACDFVCRAFGSPLEICREIVAAGILFDQLIEEGTWVHISFDPRLRGQVLTKRDGGGYGLGLPT